MEGSEPDPLPFGLALIEAQVNDPACQAFRLWVAGGKEGVPPHKRSQPCLNNSQDEDPEELKWLGTLELELVDLTRPDRPRAGAVLAHVHDPTLLRNSLSR